MINRRVFFKTALTCLVALSFSPLVGAGAAESVAYRKAEHYSRLDSLIQPIGSDGVRVHDPAHTHFDSHAEWTTHDGQHALRLQSDGKCNAALIVEPGQPIEDVSFTYENLNGPRPYLAFEFKDPAKAGNQIIKVDLKDCHIIKRDKHDEVECHIPAPGSKRMVVKRMAIVTCYDATNIVWNVKLLGAGSKDVPLKFDLNRADAKRAPTQYYTDHPSKKFPIHTSDWGDHLIN